MKLYILYVLYGIYNLLYEAISISLMFFAEIYLNGFLIPERFIWNKNGTKRVHPIIWANKRCEAGSAGYKRYNPDKAG